MEEKKKSNQQNINYILLIVGILALVLSYFLVFQKFNDKKADVTKKIETLKTEYNTLKQKDKNRELFTTGLKKFEDDYKTLLAKFDGGISYESIIMYNNNMAGLAGYKVVDLVINENKSSYVFGNLSANNQANNNAQNTKPVVPTTGLAEGYVQSYTVKAQGSYEQLKAMLDGFVSSENKRRVLRNVSFAFDAAVEKIECTAVVDEYYITGENRKETPEANPTFGTSSGNVFFNGISAVAGQ